MRSLEETGSPTGIDLLIDSGEVRASSLPTHSSSRNHPQTPSQRKLKKPPCDGISKGEGTLSPDSNEPSSPVTARPTSRSDRNPDNLCIIPGPSQTCFPKRDQRSGGVTEASSLLGGSPWRPCGWKGSTYHMGQLHPAVRVANLLQHINQVKTAEGYGFKQDKKLQLKHQPGFNPPLPSTGPGLGQTGPQITGLDDQEAPGSSFHLFLAQSRSGPIQNSGIEPVSGAE
ncbi:hypothetical protein E5288_WYG000160 [Bos mutus]|uniref:Uncharacterized protein n=1 Tax=Bos mutus TaxID=72004 RepID=A0A6B0QSI5_9CETA|nr:hypothetical protein [Bos mutus]